MKVERFFEKFETLAETPGAIRGLRALVLDLAMQGRLLPQDPADEPSRTTLLRARTRPTKRDPETEQALAEAEDPYPVPASWCWVPLASAMWKITDGTHHSPPNGERGDFKYVTAKNIKNEGIRLEGITYVSREVHNEIYSRCDPRLGDVLYIKDGATTGIATINDLAEPFSMLSSVALLRPTAAVDNRFLLWAMRSPFFYSETRNSMKGAAITRVTLSVLGSSLIPLPPLAEQKRIVVKVDELMALCDRLEAQQRERETRHAALASASLARFSEDPTPANLKFLFHGSYDIEPSELRNAVLTLAIEGKLVPQDRSDESAQKYLERLRRGRSRPRYEKETTADQAHESAQQKDSGPFALPASWCWTQLGDLAGLVTSGSRDWARYYSADGAVFVRMGNLSRGNYRLRLDKLQRVTPPKAAEGDRTRLEPNDLLVSITGEVGLLGLIPQGFGEAYINQHTCLVRLPAELHTRFIAEYFRSPFAQRYFGGPQRGLKNSFRLSDVTQMPVPVPPVAEQRRIVAKVDQLMALIDDLEARLLVSRANGEKLLEAVVAELTEAARAA